MTSPNSGLTCNPSFQEVKKTVKFTCESTVPDVRTGGYRTRFDEEEYDYIHTVYNEHVPTLTNGTLREKWDNSNDPRFQQYNVDTGQPIFENYCRTDAGSDEGYFQHLWEFPSTHSSERDVLVKYEPIYEDANGNPTTDKTLATAQSLLAQQGSCVRKVKVTNNFTLGKVSTNLSGLPSGDDASFIQLVGTDDVAIIFTYTSDTRTVLQVGDVVNGHTVTDVVNFADTKADRKIVHRVLGDNKLKLNNTKGIQVGDNVTGYGNTVIPAGTTIKSVDNSENTVKLSFSGNIDGLNRTNRNKIRTILVQDAGQNQIPDTNYCWAKLGSNTSVGVKNISFKVEGPGIHYMDFVSTTTSAGEWTNEKIFNEGGNAIFKSGSTKSKTVDFDGGSLVIKAEPVNDGGEWDSRWYIESFTGTLPKIGTAFQTKFDGGKDKATIHFKISGTAPTETAQSGPFTKEATYTASISGAEIRVKAGYGIIDRAAAVGIFISKRKDVLYTPIFRKQTDLIPQEAKELAVKFPGLGTLEEFREVGIENPIVDTNCDPFLNPQVNIPSGTGTQNNSIQLTSSNNSVVLQAIEDKIDEISSTSDVDEMVEEIEKIFKEQNPDPTVDQSVLDNLSSNLRKINKAEDKVAKSEKKFKKKFGDADRSVSQDTASNKLINDILNKIGEIPDDLSVLLPADIPQTIDTVDGENESDFNLVKNAYRDLPATQDRIQFIVEDLSLNDDESYLDYGKNSLRTTITFDVIPRWLLGTPTIGDEISDEAELVISGTALGGASPANDLYLLVRDVNDSGAIQEFEIFGGSVPQMKYTNQSGTSTAVGTRASFNITSAGGNYTATVNTNATGYSVNDLILIKGGVLGGTNNTNDCFIQITSLTSGGEIDQFSVTGTSTGAATFNNRSQVIEEAAFDVNVEWSNTDATTDDIYIPVINDDNAGSGYRVNDTISIPGSNLGGGTNNDCLITVTEVDPEGGLIDYTTSTAERPQTLYANISASYATNTGTSIGTGATFNVLKGENATGSPTYFVSINNAGTNYNKVVVPGGVTVDVVNKKEGIMQINGGDLNEYPSNFTVTFSSSAPSPLQTGTSYKASKISDTKFFVYTQQNFGGTNKAGTRIPPLITRIRLSDSPQGISGVAFGTFGVAQTVNYLTDGGVQYVDTIDVTATGEVYPDRVWRGLGYEYQGEWIKEYEFNLITTSENIAKSSFNEGNPIQSKPTTAKLTKKLKPKADKIEVDDTSLFLSSGYLMIPKWIRKTENYLELGVEGVNKIVNDRNHYYYDGEEIIYYSSKTATSFEGIERSQFNTSYLFETSPEPFAKNGGVVNSYQKGYSVQQYWPYQPKEE
tara:strand:+ start:2246 stop:6259 length:4014 start_codon:yes stop_codon:yes gene_type:complete